MPKYYYVCIVRQGTVLILIYQIYEKLFSYFFLGITFVFSQNIQIKGVIVGRTVNLAELMVVKGTAMV